MEILYFYRYPSPLMWVLKSLHGQASGLQYLDFCSDFFSVSELFILEGTRDHILCPINDSVAVPCCKILTLYILKIWSFSKFDVCSVSWNNSHINFGAIFGFTMCFTIAVLFLLLFLLVAFFEQTDKSYFQTFLQ